MNKLNCCGSPKWGPEMDMGHFDSFEFMLGKCTHCGAWWMDVFCIAANSSGYEQVTDEEARIMLATPWGPELKAIMKAWFNEH